MPDLRDDVVSADGSGSVVVPNSDSGRGGAHRSRLAVVGWAVLAAVVVIGSVVLAVSAENSNADKARGCERVEGGACVTVFDLVGPPGHLPSVRRGTEGFPAAQ